MTDEILSEVQGDNDNSVDALKNDLSKVRTGRAHVGILDGVRIDYYGTMSPLNQVAAVSVPDPRQITVKPWDRSLIGAVEKAIMQADLGLTPTSDGELVRLNIPPLTTERRRDLVKMIKRYGEDAKVSVRNHRREANEQFKEAEKEGLLPEDDARKGTATVQDITNDYVKRVDDLVAAKEIEILED
jgi:ribosome recycling factor